MEDNNCRFFRIYRNIEESGSLKPLAKKKINII